MKTPAAATVSLVISLVFSCAVYAAPLPGQTSAPLQPEKPLASSPAQNNGPKKSSSSQASTDFMQNSMAVSQTSADPRISGVQEGDTVSGIVSIGPNQSQIPGIRKVSYYLNGAQSGKVYQSPFLWGGVSGTGAAGFDTKTIADGDYKLDIVYTDPTGDHALTVNFKVNNSGAPPQQQGDPNAVIWGASRNQTVSGTVNITPNPAKIPAGAQQVTWTLDGHAPVTVTQSPYTFGGPNGNGSTGFDTRTLQDGVYTLRFFAQSTQGNSISSSVTFVVENQPDTAPATTVVSASGRTAGGLQFPAGTSLVDVEHSGSLSFIANQNALYIVNASNPAQPQLLSAVNFNFNPPVKDIIVTPDAKAIFVLEQGPVGSSPGFFNGRLWRVDISNPAAPVRQLVESGSSSSTGQAKSLAIENGTLYVIIDEEHSLLPCPLDGSACGIPSDLYSLRDLMVINPNGHFSARRGGTTLRSTPGAGDFSDTVTPAQIAYLSGRGQFLFVAMKNGTLAVYDTTQQNVQTGIVPVVKTIDPQGSDPIFTVVEGNRLAVLDSTGLIEIFDITNLQNPVRVDTLTISGARSVAFENGTLYAVTANQYRITAQPQTAPPPPASDARVLGVQEGQTVSGTVQIRPNPAQLPGIRKISYYLNGAKSGKVYRSPFMWGGISGDGTTGFDTRTLADGSYTLSMVYTDAAGDHVIDIRFTTDN